MQRVEIDKLLSVVTATYPRFFQKQTEEDFENLEESWEFVLADYTYEEGSMGLRSYMSSDNGFPPSPGQVAEMIRKIRAGKPEDTTTAAEAWELVWKAIQRLDWYHPEREFEKLPTKIQKIIGSAGALKEMGIMDTSDVLIGEKARFIHQYDAYTEREEDYAKLPMAVRGRLEERTMEAIEG